MDPCNTSSPGNVQNALIGASVLSLIGLPGNLLFIILVTLAKQKKSTTTYLLLGLTVADILNLLGVDIVAIMVFLFKEHEKRKTTILLLNFPAKIVANFTLTVLALERYNALVRTMKSFVNISGRKIIIGEIISWFVGLGLSVIMFRHELVHLQEGIPVDWHIHTLWTSLLFIGYIIPLVIVVLCYSNIIKGLYCDRTILGQKVQDEARLSDKKRLIRILVVITLVFLACNVPTFIILMLRHYSPCYGANTDLYEVIVILGCLSSFVNPFIFGLHTEKYRKQAKEIFCNKKENETVQTSFDSFDIKM